MFDRKTQFSGRRHHRLRAAAAAALLAPAVLVACGSDDESAAAGGTSLSTAQPAKDATVSLPFTVKVDAGVPLGPTESGKHHVHLWLDNHANDYLVVESDTAEITSGQMASLSGKPLGVSPGMHTIHVSLRNANHSAAGWIRRSSSRSEPKPGLRTSRCCTPGIARRSWAMSCGQ
jgi:hypothetical protein